MESLPIKYLKEMKTISAVHVLISFLQKVNSNNSLEFKYAISDIAYDSNISKNTVRRAIDELISADFITLVSSGKGSETSKYRVNIPIPTLGPPKVEPPKIEPLVWKRTTASSMERQDREEEINDNITNANFDDMDLYTEDINSISLVNSNIYMTDNELGKLANRLMKEVFLPSTINSNKANYWFPQQMKLMKDLLVEWRTEQVVAAIRYWTCVSPPANGVSSLRFLMFKSRGKSNMIIALDYHKQEYLKYAHEGERKKVENKIEENKIRTAEAEEKIKKDKELVDSMSNDDFIKNLIGGWANG